MDHKSIIVSTEADQDGYSDIQTAINDLTSEGGVVNIRPGTYIIDISNLIRITKSNVSLIGSGPASVIKLANSVSSQSTPKDIIKIGDGTNSIENIVISNIRIDGNSTNNEYSFGIKINENNSNIIIENCIFENCFSGGINTTTIDGSNRCKHLIISNNIIKNSSYHGISLSGINNSSVHGNSVYCDSYPISTGIYLYYANNISVFGNTINKFKYGIGLQKCEGICVNGNNIVNCQHTGIMAQQGGYNVITGNILYDNAQDSNEIDRNEIQLRSNQGLAEKNDLISGNIIFNQNDELEIGIKEYKYAGTINPDNNLIIGNNFKLETGATRVSLIGSGSTSEHNEGN